MAAFEASTFWGRPVIEAIERLAKLPVGWDTYGAPPADHDAIKHAVTFVERFCTPEIKAPEVSAGRSGEVILGWHKGSREVDLVFSVTGVDRYVVIDSEKEKIVERGAVCSIKSVDALLGSSVS